MEGADLANGITNVITAGGANVIHVFARDVSTAQPRSSQRWRFYSVVKQQLSVEPVSKSVRGLSDLSRQASF